jgi:hypothetical protein
VERHQFFRQLHQLGVVGLDQELIVLHPKLEDQELEDIMVPLLNMLEQQETHLQLVLRKEIQVEILQVTQLHMQAVEEEGQVL